MWWTFFNTATTIDQKQRRYDVDRRGNERVEASLQRRFIGIRLGVAHHNH